MYTRSDGHMTGNVQQGKHFDRMRGVASKGPGGSEKSHEGHPAGPAELGGDEQHETAPHPVTGAHEVHIKHHLDGEGNSHYTVHAFHEPIGPHHEAGKASVTHHHVSSDAHDMAQTHFPNDGDESGEEEGAETLSGITGGMPGQNEENTHRRGF
jgi:hypothetical protein